MKVIPEEVVDAEDVFTEEELKQLERDARMDGTGIPNWSIQYKLKGKEKEADN